MSAPLRPRRPIRLDDNDARSIEAYIAEHQAELTEALIANQKAQTAELTEQIDELRTLFLSAFPDGDPGLHKQAHLLMMKAAEEEAAFWQDMKKKLAQSGVLAVFTGLAIALTVWFQVWVKGATK